MKKSYVYQKTIFIVIFICFSYISVAQNFKVQHLQDDVGNSGSTNTSFTAVSSLNNAVAIPANNRKTHGGPDGSTGGKEGDDMSGARVLTATNTLTYYRESGSTSENNRFNTSIWEYIGSGGGENEFIVRGRYVVDLNGATYTEDQIISGISNKDKCIPFITGIMNNSDTDDADSGTAVAYLTSNTNLRVEKGGTNSPNVKVYITLVEFTGSNWNVLHGNSGDVGGDSGSITLYDGSDGTGTATSVSSWSESIIFSQHRGDTAIAGTNDSHSDNWPTLVPGSDSQSVDWQFYSTHDSDGTNKHIVHVLNNTVISVTRYTDTGFDKSEQVDISASGLTDLSQALIVGSTYHSGTGQGYGRGWKNYSFNSLTEVEVWTHRAGSLTSTISTELQIVNFVEPIKGPAAINSNISLWLKADNGVQDAVSDIAEDSDPVLNWLDYSGNYNNSTQITGGNQPVYNEAAINFNPVVNFDGDDLLQTAALSLSGDVTVFTVAEGQSGTQKQILNINGGDNIIMEYSDGTPTYRARMYDGVNTGEITTTTNVANGTTLLANYDLLSGGTSQLFINGISINTDATNTYAPTSPIANIGGHPSDSAKRWDGGIAEIIVYDGTVTNIERNKIESYLAIKYGITLGNNGTSQDYVDSDNRTIWNQVANTGYNYNVTGIGRDDASRLEQKQSRTINTTHDITIGIKEIATTNSDNNTDFFDDKTFLMWGHDNGGTTATTDITKDFGSSTGTTTSVSVTPIVRTWKIVNSDSIPTVLLSIPESMVSATNPGGEEYVMIIADDAAFTTNVTSATMEDVGTELEVDFYFDGTKYITFGSTPITSEISRAVSFDRTGDTYLSAGDVNDLANMDFTISAWVKRNTGVGKFDVVSKRNYFDENRDIDPGPDNDGNYTHGYAFRINTSNQFRMVWRDPDDSSNNILQTSATIPENEWHHIAATFNSSTNMCSLYIDGYLEDSDDTLDPMETPSDAHFLIGAANHMDRQQKLDGSVDEVRVWNVALSGDQIRYIMNQEILENSGFADGKVLPTSTTKNEIVSIPWNNLIAYYPMSRLVFGSVKDESDSGNDASMINYSNIDEQTAPLPYKTTQNGDWDDSNSWLNGDVQYLPGVDSYLDALETIDYNIVEIDHEITMDNSDTSLIPASRNGMRTLLALTVNSGGKLIIDGDNTTGDGYGLTISHYLKLDGKIDLEGESQLIQTENSDLDPTSSGTLEKDQQGTKDLFTYNYWSAPVGFSNNTTNNNSYNLSNNILKNGTISATPTSITFLSSSYDGNVSGTDIEIADYWIWKYSNLPSNTYASWQHLRSTGTINPGEGFTMKGVESSGSSFTSTQNYVFDGKPFNGDITLTITAGNDYLVGNPYASAIDADEFIKDNISNLETDGRNTNGNIINGVLYFWDHFGSGSHALAEYEGGYATYTLMGGAVAINNDVRINETGTFGTKTPSRYIPVGQGFFVSSILDTDLNNDGTTPDPNDPSLTETIDGGQLLFKNSQRVFQKEGVNSLFVKSNNINKNNNISSDNKQRIRLMLDSPDGYHRQLLVGADMKCSTNFDLGYDAPIIENNKEDMYWKQSNNKLVIQAIDCFSDDKILPLGIKINKAGIATIKIDDLENIDNSLNILLHDKASDTYYNLRNSSYELFLERGEHADRFELTFASVDLLNNAKFENNDVQIYISEENRSITILNSKAKYIDNLKVYNLLGQIINEIEIKSNEKNIKLKSNNISSAGIYIVKVKADELIVTKKFNLRG